MKKINLILLLAIISFASCDNNAENQYKKSVNNLSTYVDSVEKVTPDYSNSYWENIESNYNDRVAKAEAVIANLDENAKKELDESKIQFIAFKERYIDQKQKYEVKLEDDKKENLRTTLFGENKVTSELNFAWVNAANIVEVYERFVNAVDANKTNYSESDWKIISDAFKNLDDRRDAISKELNGKDKLKITEQKVRFGTIKIVN